eukprot:CAMPEP_0174694164 /NCGR_PEP_ID=MMETSP1094-20130205/799_1 /TAXON_ID=156173 /ORGANISM="Chrysochromulina brevifilum, Strain UTEX LB 985" /LENGTH=92 /DNA_ID=CAMNT_0015890317 /DNA_START=1101 /DNA_END=1376 /DNA_ORIENTATION=+
MAGLACGRLAVSHRRLPGGCSVLGQARPCRHMPAPCASVLERCPGPARAWMYRSRRTALTPCRSASGPRKLSTSSSRVDYSEEHHQPPSRTA